MMLFSDIPKVLINAEIKGLLPKKKIKLITDHSNKVESTVLFVINNNKDFKESYLKIAISKGLKVILTNKYLKKISLTQVIVKDIDREVYNLLNRFKISNKISGINQMTKIISNLFKNKFNSMKIKLTINNLGHKILQNTFKEINYFITKK